MASPIEADTPSHTTKKRRIHSSRGVSSLTPEQLQRKRENDRASQRAIRERTKNSIDQLNQRIRELESQQPYHDLQVVLKEKEAVQAQNEDIRARLESVLTIIKPIVHGSSGLNDLASAAEKSPLLVPPHHQHHETFPHTASAGLHDLTTASPSNGVFSLSGADVGRQWMYSSDAPASHMRRYSNESAQFDQRLPPHTQTDMPFDERLGVGYLLDNGQRRAVDPSLPPPRQPPTINVSSSQHAQYAPPLVAHMTLPRNIVAKCHFDVMLSSFLEEQQSRAAEGILIQTLVGPQYPNFTSLVDVGRDVESHPLSKLVTGILILLFPDMDGVPEKVAVVYIMFLILRWQIEPTMESYGRIPDWITPRPSQLFTAHPHWVDYIPWPRLRDKIIASQPFVLFEDLFINITSTISLNWPYEPHECLIPASAVHDHSIPLPESNTTAAHGSLDAIPKEDDQWIINPVFEAYLRDLSNWSLRPSFKVAFPAFAECVRIK